LHGQAAASRTLEKEALMKKGMRRLKKPSLKRILIVDDHPVFRDGLSHLINREPDLEVCGEAGNSRPAEVPHRHRIGALRGSLGGGKYVSELRKQECMALKIASPGMLVLAGSSLSSIVPREKS
jgi:hypothetical protein